MCIEHIKVAIATCLEEYEGRINNPSNQEAIKQSILHHLNKAYVYLTNDRKTTANVEFVNVNGHLGINPLDDKTEYVLNKLMEEN